LNLLQILCNRARRGFFDRKRLEMSRDLNFLTRMSLSVDAGSMYLAAQALVLHLPATEDQRGPNKAWESPDVSNDAARLGNRGRPGNGPAGGRLSD
jgi:hypothetical protein